jgi:ATP-dependent helicase Lhr and Lhr-like helicase
MSTAKQPIKPSKSGLNQVHNWFTNNHWEIFTFQQECWLAVQDCKEGILHAPTGSGKTFALWMPHIIRWLDAPKQNQKGLQLIWITPLRALAKDMERQFRQSLAAFDLDIQVGRRTGDVSASIRKKQEQSMPQVLITTPESLHVLMAQKNHERYFKRLHSVVVDEWHELMGSKRGTQTELFLARARALRPEVKTWGISATLGNMEEASEVLMGSEERYRNSVTIKASIQKNIQVESILPTSIEFFPWHGHLGLHLIDELIPILQRSRSTLVFTNTRGQAERWFQELLERVPEWAGQIALHHGSLDRKVRNWVEESLHDERLKIVVCTSSLDLGVDFSPVETVIQVGSPKGVARFIQRAGRSGHQPGATSTIHFLPTHALELLEADALREAVRHDKVEPRPPILSPTDVLLQYLMTRAVGSGFTAEPTLKELRSTFAYRHLSEQDFHQIIQFLCTGGPSLQAYPEFAKLEIDEKGRYFVGNHTVARRHRMNIGTISSDANMQIKYLSGGRIGTIEEWFIGQLKEGDRFWFSGRRLELIRVEQMTAYVRRASSGSAKVPSWLGGRMSLSSNMSEMLKESMLKAVNYYDYEQSRQSPNLIRPEQSPKSSVEIDYLKPILAVQQSWSMLPGPNQLLIEKSFSREGCHLFFYPFEGRNVHEGLSTLVAHRIAKLVPITFTIAMNDYGFELLSDQDIPIQQALEQDLFSTEHLLTDIYASLNNSELAKRRFREIAQIAGLVFQGFPGQGRSTRHLQMSSSLFFEVFQSYEPNHLLLQQALDEVLFFQFDEIRLRQVLNRIQTGDIAYREPKRFTPYAFPIMVDRLREKMSSEKLIDRIKKMQAQLIKHV